MLDWADGFPRMGIIDVPELIHLTTSLGLSRHLQTQRFKGKYARDFVDNVSLYYSIIKSSYVLTYLLYIKYSGKKGTFLLNPPFYSIIY